MAKYLRADCMLSPAAVMQLGELAVDDLGGIEHGDEAHEIAGEHAVEQEVDLLGGELDARLRQRGGDLGLGLGDLLLVALDALLRLRDVAERLSTVSVIMPGSTPSLGAMSCFSFSAPMRSSMSRMLWRSASTFFCMSTTGTSVTMPSAESSRSRMRFSRSSLVSVHKRREDELVVTGELLAPAPRCSAASCRTPSIASMRLRACS